MKSNFEKHVTKCHTTKTKFSLQGAGLSRDACDVCAIPHRVMEYFNAIVHPDHHQFLEDCKTNIQLYEGHRVRVVTSENI